MTWYSSREEFVKAFNDKVQMFARANPGNCVWRPTHRFRELMAEVYLQRARLYTSIGRPAP